jgi:murein L,D-transpeptidase YcbB/YkuD
MGADPWFFDTAMAEAVRRFQRRHELPPDGVWGERTREAANVPVGERIGQIAVTMERWRWLPRDLGPRYAWVNVGSASLTVIENDQSVLSMRVVVGHKDRPTPSLVSAIDQVVFNPTWTVPRTIAVEDLLPQQQHDRGFLPRHRVRVFTGAPPAVQEIDPAGVPWERLGPDRFPYRLVQDAGPGNSLGRIKIAMDNPFDIYLHDTPAKRMFDLSARTLSSGCVRLEDAAGLATLLLSGDRAWTAAETAARTSATETQTINLKRRLPIYIVYLTAWSDAAGEIHYGHDIYGRDARVLAALRASR